MVGSDKFQTGSNVSFFYFQTKIEKNIGKIVNDLVDIDFEQTVMK